MQIAVENLQTAAGTWRVASATQRSYIAAAPRDMQRIIGHYTAPEYYADYTAAPTWTTEDWQTISAAIIRPIAPGCVLRCTYTSVSVAYGPPSYNCTGSVHALDNNYQSIIDIADGYVVRDPELEIWHRYSARDPHTALQTYPSVSMNVGMCSYTSASGKEYNGQFVQTNSYPHFVLGYDDVVTAICPFTGRELGTFQVPSSLNVKRISAFSGRVYVTVGQVVHWCSFV